MVIGVYQGIQACIAQGIQVAFRTVTVVLIADNMVLTGIGRIIRNGGLQVGNRKIRILKNITDILEFRVEEVAVTVTMLSALGRLTHQVTGEAQQCTTGLVCIGVIPITVLALDVTGNILGICMLPGECGGVLFFKLIIFGVIVLP